jgi:hypothetical protein
MRATIITLSLLIGFALGSSNHNFKPKDGYVPNADTAIKIAVAVWGPIYGQKEIDGEKPYKARLEKGVWIVEGSLPEGWFGGVALAEIQKENGKIVRVSHGE